MIPLPFNKLQGFFNKKREVHTAIVYGSFSKGRIRKSSDVDIAILVKEIPGDLFSYTSELSLLLDDMCGRETDVLILNTASPHIAFRAIKEGKVVFQRKNRSLWNQFVVKIIQMNEDMEILYRKVRRG